ncbi:hypothetical protein BB560_000704 [Smittium megazygosporum]|uniref:Uncharacterized protein n=1 Tax=Smittium megazygosporum TaxID=133381 RepID=A0A2T9ZJP8_9FUNG|nr:hypothetical protein BB560_000704 [Smittium megazygosporum]
MYSGGPGQQRPPFSGNNQNNSPSPYNQSPSPNPNSNPQRPPYQQNPNVKDNPFVGPGETRFSMPDSRLPPSFGYPQETPGSNPNYSRMSAPLNQNSGYYSNQSNIDPNFNSPNPSSQSFGFPQAPPQNQPYSSQNNYNSYNNSNNSPNFNSNHSSMPSHDFYQTKPRTKPAT